MGVESLGWNKCKRGKLVSVASLCSETTQTFSDDIVLLTPSLQQVLFLQSKQRWTKLRVLFWQLFDWGVLCFADMVSTRRRRTSCLTSSSGKTKSFRSFESPYWIEPMRHCANMKPEPSFCLTRGGDRKCSVLFSCLLMKIWLLANPFITSSPPGLLAIASSSNQYWFCFFNCYSLSVWFLV